MPTMPSYPQKMSKIHLIRKKKTNAPCIVERKKKKIKRTELPLKPKS